MDLNQGQKEAAEAFFNFLFSDEQGFIISGPAGTGKTFLMSYLIDNIMPRYNLSCELLGIKPLYDNVVMCATTNKAAEVLAQSTNRPTQTIHSYLGLKVQENFSTGETKLTTSSKWSVKENKIIFIDECSMIDRSLFKILQESFINCKIVYVGDHCQLAPVLENISPIYNQRYPFYALTESVRNNKYPALMSVCSQLRNTVETGLFTPINTLPGVIDYLTTDDLQKHLDNNFKDLNIDSKILAYTNSKVTQYNEYIRYIRELPTEYTVGETLINNTAISAKGLNISVEEELTILDITDTINKYNIINDINIEYKNAKVKNKYNVSYDIRLPVNREYVDELIKYFKKLKDWYSYFEIKNNFPDLRPKDASTVHKSQGSTYDSVVIDLGNISKNNKPKEVARMLYVAFSRARSHIYLHGSLAEKYGGLIINE